MKNTLLFLVSFFLLVSCKKDDSGLGENGIIRGTLYIHDTISNNPVPVANADIYIGFESKPDATHYNYKVKSDNSGNFDFLYLGEKGTYTIYTEYTTKVSGQDMIYKKDTSGVMAKKTPTIFKLMLEPQNHTGNMIGTVLIKDSLTNSLVPVVNANVYLGYKFGPTSSNYLLKVVTDINGYFSTSIVDKSTFDSYQLYIEKNIPTGGHSIQYTNLITYLSFVSAQNKIQLLPSDSIGYYSILFRDNNNTPQPNVNVCLFSNRHSFLNSAVCSGSFYNSKTNYNGLMYVSNLSVNGKYYIKAYQVAGQDTTWVKDSLIAPNSRYYRFTYTFQ